MIIASSKPCIIVKFGGGKICLLCLFLELREWEAATAAQLEQLIWMQEASGNGGDAEIWKFAHEQLVFYHTLR